MPGAFDVAFATMPFSRIVGVDSFNSLAHNAKAAHIGIVQQE